jgi:hypothetical protein
VQRWKAAREKMCRGGRCTAKEDERRKRSRRRRIEEGGRRREEEEGGVRRTFWRQESLRKALKTAVWGP